MSQYLLDTNIILRLSNPTNPQYNLVTDAVYRLRAQGHQCVITPQVLIEFWVVATRPMTVNGFGWTIEQANNAIDRLLDRFPLLEDRPDIFPLWLQLIKDNNIQGKRSHDIRLIAVMLSHSVDRLLTLNPSDFAVTAPITVVHPQTLQ